MLSGGLKSCFARARFGHTHDSHLHFNRLSFREAVINILQQMMREGENRNKRNQDGLLCRRWNFFADNEDDLQRLIFRFLKASKQFKNTGVTILLYLV